MLVVDDLSDGTKFRNLVDCNVWDYWDKDRFRRTFDTTSSCRRAAAVLPPGRVLGHDRVGWPLHDGEQLRVFEGAARVLLRRGIPFLYASSAAVYGQGPTFREERRFESPLNVYGYSKLLFDRYASERCGEVKARLWGCATSTSMVRASSTRTRWQRRLSSAQSSCWRMGKCGCSRAVMAMATGSNAATSCTSTTSWR